MSAEDDFKKELPHLLVLAVLLLILLVVVTKFKWVHCSQVPGNWCDVYCSMVGKSRVAVVSGGPEPGMGNPIALRNLVSNLRPYTYLEGFPESGLSASLLSGYELVIFENMTAITPRQAKAIQQYADQGGSILWVGNAGSHYYLSPADLMDARDKNDSTPGYYEEYLKQVKDVKGFGPLSTLLRVTYQGNESGTNLRLKIEDRNALVVHGLNTTFSVTAKAFGKVNADVSAADRVASIYGTANCKYDAPCPAIVSNKYAGYVLYSAIPVEDLQSSTAINNLFDFLVTC